MLKSLSVAAILACATPALGGQTCGERHQIVDRLMGKYKESHRASGLQSPTKMVEIWTSSDTGSWTILITDASGQTCVAAVGNSWLELEEVAKLPGTTG